MGNTLAAFSTPTPGGCATVIEVLDLSVGSPGTSTYTLDLQHLPPLVQMVYMCSAFCNTVKY